MKKALWIVAAATLFFSCQKEQEAVTPDAKSFTFKASIEKLAADTKADMDSEYGLMWAEGDKIGIGVYGWNDSQPFTLVGDAGSDEGSFEWDYTGDFDQDNAYAAFFPWQAQGGAYNSAWEGVIYFKMQGSYGNTGDLVNTPYTSGKMLNPLLGQVENGRIDFKHAGAAVKVTINNLPAGSHSIGMSADQQIYGNYHIDLNYAGSKAMALDEGADNTACNSIWLNYEPASEERSFTFIFPTPAMTTPKLSFQIWDENGIQVWSKNLKAQTVSPGRGDVLAMPAIDITPYSQFKISEQWVLRGYLEGNDWTYDVGSVTDAATDGGNGTYIVKGVKVIGTGDQCAVKIKHPGESWDESWPSGNYIIGEPGTYDIIFNPSTQSINAVPSECPYPDANVSLYFSIGKANNDIRLKSTDLGTASWPGDAPVATEVLGGVKFYKWSYPAIKVWGQTVTYSLVDKGYWSLDDAQLTFSDKKLEYFFNMDSDKNVTAIEKPVEPEITIDGNFSDWAGVVGNDKSGSKYTTTLKAYSDGSSMFIYLKRVNVGEGVHTFDDNSHVYFYFDKDNDATNGSSDWYRKGADDVNNEFRVKFASNGLRGILANANYHAQTVSVNDSENGIIEMELKFDLAAFDDNSTVDLGEEIKIFCLGYSSSEFTGSLESVIIPVAQ